MKKSPSSEKTLTLHEWVQYGSPLVPKQDIYYNG